MFVCMALAGFFPSLNNMKDQLNENTTHCDFRLRLAAFVCLQTASFWFLFVCAHVCVFLKNPLCDPLFGMFWLQTFFTGNRWSGHRLINLNVHQSTQRPKDLSHLDVQISSSQGGVDQKWLRVRSGSQLAGGWGLRQPFISLCPFELLA